MKKRWTKSNLEECVKNSKTYKEIIEKLGLKVGASSYQTLQTYLYKYNIEFKSEFIKDKYTKDNLSKIVKESINYADVILKMNLLAHDTNIKTLKKYINKYNIDVSHFDSFYKNKDRGHVTKKPLLEVMVENSNYDRSTLKRRLFEEGIKQRICDLCGQNDIWQGKQISLILDHINGINNDHRLNNLRIVCPNCEATLPTHAGRNIKSKKRKCECGNAISYSSNKCRICHAKSTRKVERPDLEIVKQEVDESNCQIVANKYGVSRSTIRRWIK